MAWNTICRPTCYGGLGVKNIKMQALALRVRWEWLRRIEQTRPWQGIPFLIDEDAHSVFNSLVKITVGNGESVLFWKDRWLNGMSVADIAPAILSLVHMRTQNQRTVCQALIANRWEHHISGDIPFMTLIQLIHLRLAISEIERDMQAPDEFSWPWDISGKYTAKSVYSRLCLGLTRSETFECIWRSGAILQCKKICLAGCSVQIVDFGYEGSARLAGRDCCVLYLFTG